MRVGDLNTGACFMHEGYKHVVCGVINQVGVQPLAEALMASGVITISDAVEDMIVIFNKDEEVFECGCDS